MTFLKTLVSGLMTISAILIGAVGFIMFITGVFTAMDAGVRPDRALVILVGSIVAATLLLLGANRVSKEPDDRRR